MFPKPKPSLLKPRKRIPRSAVKKRSRPKSETLRIYGPPERRAWMKILPCSACGVVGYSEGAHVLGNGGMGRKADAKTQAPLCGPHDVVRSISYHGAPFVRERGLFMGCHRQFDEFRGFFNAFHPDFNAETAASDCEQAWQNHLKETAE